MAKRKNKKPKTYTDDFGKIHIIVESKPQRNLMHFEHQLRTRAQVVESKKHKAPKHKNKIFDED